MLFPCVVSICFLIGFGIPDCCHLIVFNLCFNTRFKNAVVGIRGLLSLGAASKPHQLGVGACLGFRPSVAHWAEPRRGRWRLDRGLPLVYAGNRGPNPTIDFKGVSLQLLFQNEFGRHRLHEKTPIEFQNSPTGSYETRNTNTCENNINNFKHVPNYRKQSKTKQTHNKHTINY
jgi:hypothetical protein